MSEAKYTRLSTEPSSHTRSPTNESEEDEDDGSPPAQFVEEMGAASSPPMDPRFIQPNPGPLKRIALLLFIVFLFWLAVSLRTSKLKPVVDDEQSVSSWSPSRFPDYAHRYPDYRSVAKPEITETIRRQKLVNAPYEGR